MGNFFGDSSSVVRLFQPRGLPYQFRELRGVDIESAVGKIFWPFGDGMPRRHRGLSRDLSLALLLGHVGGVGCGGNPTANVLYKYGGSIVLTGFSVI